MPLGKARYRAALVLPHKAGIATTSAVTIAASLRAPWPSWFLSVPVAPLLPRVVYRLHPCGVFALNYDPRRDGNSTLVESAICIAFLRGTDLWGKAFLFNAMWQEGLPLGESCAFEMPRWGLLRRAVAAEGVNPILLMLQSLCEQAVTTGAATRPEVEVVIRRCGGAESLPTPVERGFPNLVRTVWFGAEPFPALDFELQLIGADFRQRKVSVPLWFRPSRAEFAGTGQ